MRKRIRNILLGFDQFIQTVVYFGKYNPDLTISQVIGYKRENSTSNSVENFVCKILRRLENEHCVKSIEEDESLYKDGKG